jgi:hypothetical protein
MLILWGLFFVLMFLGMPVAFAIGLSGFSFFALSGTIPVSIVEGLSRSINTVSSR